MTSDEDIDCLTFLQVNWDLTAGTFPYHCTIHPGMVGTVVVR